MAKSSLTGRSSAQGYLQSLTGKRNLVRVLGILVVLWGELGTFHYSLRDCQWPAMLNMKVRRDDSSLTIAPSRAEEEVSI